MYTTGAAGRGKLGQTRCMLLAQKTPPVPLPLPAMMVFWSAQVESEFLSTTTGTCILRVSPRISSHVHLTGWLKLCSV
jgi:hypothetical protein